MSGRTFQESIESHEEAKRRDFDCMTKDGVPIRNVEVDNLSERTSPKDLQDLLSKYGVIVKCVLQRRLHGSLYGSVTFETVDAALRVRQDADKMGIVLRNRILRVKMARFYQQPIELNCSVFDMLTDDVLVNIFVFLPIPDTIRLERVSKRWRALSKASWYYFRKLDFLKSTWGFSTQSLFDRVDGEVVTEVLARCGNYLKEIHISPMNNIKCDEIFFAKIKTYCPNLQVLNLSVTSAMSCYIPNTLPVPPNIMSLSLKDTMDKIPESILAQTFTTCNKLSLFMGNNMHITGYYLQCLPLTKIQEIILIDCTRLDFSSLMQALSQFKNLLTFGLHIKCSQTKSNLPVEVLVTLDKHCKKLKRFEVVGFDLNIARSKELITNLSNLEVLIMKNTNINDDFLKTLSGKHGKLNRLDISDCPYVTWVGIIALASLPKLAKLSINNIPRNSPESADWDLSPDLALKKTALEYLFSSLTHLECRNSYCLSPSEVCCLIQSSPQIETVDFSNYKSTLRRVFDKIVHRILEQNRRVAFLMSYFS